jgi:hypothetical protein
MKIILTDIDDTILCSPPGSINILKYYNGKIEELTSEQYAKDKDRLKDNVELGEWPNFSDLDDDTYYFSFAQFRDPDLIYKSIVSGEPIYNNLDAIKELTLKENYELAFLTARGCLKVIKEAFVEFITKYLGSDVAGHIDLDNCYAINDENFQFKSKDAAKRKAYVITKIAKSFDKVIFIDDDENNLLQAHELNLPNLSTIKA